MPVPWLEAPVLISFRSQYGPSRGSRKNPEASRVFRGSPTSAGRLGLAGARHLLNMFSLEQGPGLAQSWGSGNSDRRLLASLPGGMPLVGGEIWT